MDQKSTSDMASDKDQIFRISLLFLSIYPQNVVCERTTRLLAGQPYIVERSDLPKQLVFIDILRHACRFVLFFEPPGSIGGHQHSTHFKMRERKRIAEILSAIKWEVFNSELLDRREMGKWFHGLTFTPILGVITHTAPIKTFLFRRRSAMTFMKTKSVHLQQYNISHENYRHDHDAS